MSISVFYEKSLNTIHQEIEVSRGHFIIVVNENPPVFMIADNKDVFDYARSFIVQGHPDCFLHRHPRLAGRKNH